jgi:hypothetical protein
MEAAGEYRFEFLKSRNSGAVNRHVMMKWDPVSLRVTDPPKSLQLRKKEGATMVEVQPGRPATRSINDLLG